MSATFPVVHPRVRAGMCLPVHFPTLSAGKIGSQKTNPLKGLWLCFLQLRSCARNDICILTTRYRSTKRQV